MIKELYPAFQHWSAKGSVYLISDTHFDDLAVKKHRPHGPTPMQTMAFIASKVHKNDTLIHLGDVGNPEYFINAWKPGKRPHLVLITGNHDTRLTLLRSIFDEVYTGPLFIAPKLVLSHEPLYISPMCFFNMHGHLHSDPFHLDEFHLNLAASEKALALHKLDTFIKNGLFSNIPKQHRHTINRATARKKKQTPKKH